MSDVIFPASTIFAHGLSTNFKATTGKDNHAVIFPSISFDEKTIIYGAYWKGAKTAWKVIVYSLKTGGFIDETLDDIVDKYDFEATLPGDIDFKSIQAKFFAVYKLKNRAPATVADEKVQDNPQADDESMDTEDDSVVSVLQPDKTSLNKAAAKNSKKAAKATEKKLDSLQSKVT